MKKPRSKIGKYGKIDPKFKKRWIAALKSGKYEQTSHWLFDIKLIGKNKVQHTYCCLGVACQISGAGKFDNNNFFKLNNAPKEDLIFESHNASRILMPFNLARQIGLTRRAQTRLANLNDRGYTFKEIAEWIKRYL